MGGGQAGSAGGSNGLAAAVVFVVGGDVADALVQSDGVVVRAQPVELAFQLAGVLDLLQVRELPLEVTEERLDPGLVVRRGRPAEVLRDASPVIARRIKAGTLILAGGVYDLDTGIVSPVDV